jgi:hypothetical protein
VFGIIKDTKLLAVEFTSCINVLMPLSMVVYGIKKNFTVVLSSCIKFFFFFFFFSLFGLLLD